ncbi:MAG: hypothetical protein IJD97_08875 [Clostridia bacterium]|nr:hypothetical protein [Clostridia bacterium]
MINRRITEFLKIPESIRIPYFGGKWYRYIEGVENKSILHEIIPGKPLNTEKRTETIIASLTSFPARIATVHLAIKSLMLQSYKPDRIILWLANEQFPDHVLPENLTQLERYGLEIKWCDDLCGHKKYYYCIKEQKENEVVITFDDDIIYPIDAIRRLMKTHEKYPGCLVCERAQSVPNSKKISYNVGRWDTISDVALKKPSYSVCPSTGGGYLIPYNSYHIKMLDKDLIKEYALRNDDMWCMFMAAENKVKFIKTRKYHKIFSIIQGSQTESLAMTNILQNESQNDFVKLKECYPDAYRRIFSDRD